MSLKEYLNEAIEDKEVVDEILSKVGESFIPKSVHRKTLDENEQFSNLISEKEKELEQLKIENMTKEEKYNYQLEQAEKIKREYTLKSNQLEVEQLFAESGIDRDVYGKFVDVIVGEDLDASKTKAQDIIETLNGFKENTVNQTKEQLLKDTPTPKAGDNKDALADIPKGQVEF